LKLIPHRPFREPTDFIAPFALAGAATTLLPHFETAAGANRPRHRRISGIGRAIVIALGHAGANVVVNFFGQPNKSLEVAEEMRCASCLSVLWMSLVVSTSS
jgi:hypothetical protein